MTGIENKDYNDVIDKQENLAKNHPDLNTREKGVLATLDIKYEKGKDITPEDIDTAMNNRFDTELAKAGTSAETPEMKTRKDQLSKDIQNTKDMKEKIALYQAFLDGLKGDVGTQIAEQKQREWQNTKAMEKESKEADKNKDRKKVPGKKEEKELLASIETNPALAVQKLSASLLWGMIHNSIIENQNNEAKKRISTAETHTEDSPENPQEKWPG